MGKNDDSTLQPTAWRRVLSNGVYVPATGGQAWLYRSVDPMPMVDVDEDLRNLGSQQLDRLFAELTESVTAQATRAVARTKGSYPRFHILATRIWKPYEPPAGSTMSPQLRRWYRDRLVPHLSVAVGLPLDNGVDLEGLSFVRRQLKRADFLIRGADGASELNWAESLVAQERVAGNARLGRLSAHDVDAIGAWWNDGRWRDCSTLPHADHLHVIHDPAVAARLSKLDESGVDCSTWTDFVPTGHSALTIAAVPHLSAANEHGAPVPTWWDGASLEALWGHWLFAAGAKAISIRGVLEPSAATLKAVQDEQRRIETMQQKRAEASKDQAAWLAQRAGATAEMEERLLETGVGPTTMDCRITVAFEGIVSGDQAWKALSSAARVPLVPISYAQPLAMFEMQPTATVSANPNICDPSARTVSHAGLNARPQLGDPAGAIMGWRDGYPVYLDPFQSVDADGKVLTVGAGETGSGKLLTLTTRVVTPSGFKTMGELEQGDTVFGSDGRPCTVRYLSEVSPAPELYDVTFSDGQVVTSCVDHQWLVSSASDRMRTIRPAREQAAARWDGAAAAADKIERLASTYSPDDEARPEEIDEILESILGRDRPHGIARKASEMLRRAGAPFRMASVTVASRQERPTVVSKTMMVFPVAESLSALIAICDRKLDEQTSNRSRWGSQQWACRREACAELLDDADMPQELPARELATLVLSRAGETEVPQKMISSISLQIREEGVVVVKRPVERVLGAAGTRTSQVNVYPTAVALKTIAGVLRDIYGESRPETLAVEERVLTTGQMIAEGVTCAGGRKRFSVRLTESLQLPDVELPVPPYTLGAWLGDGSSNSDRVTGIDASVFAEIESEGFSVEHSPDDPKDHQVKGLRPLLRAAGFDLVFRAKGTDSKHIPALYLRASHEQRLAVLQGLMDTDGTIDTAGKCELTLSNKRLASDALQLIRTLGVKASMKSSAHRYHNPQDEPGVYRQAKDRHRITFTTDLQVFRMPRKADRIPARVRPTQHRLYITSIRPAPTEPGRCIQVDSPDHTYLVEGMVPTHNTFLLMKLATQFPSLGCPTVVIDLKTDSDLSEPVLNSGGKVSDLSSQLEEGAFDPFGFAPVEVQAALATMFITSCAIFGDLKIIEGRSIEIVLEGALGYGVEKGCRSTMQALETAHAAGRLPDQVLSMVKDAYAASPMFRAGCSGSTAQTSMRDFEGLTMIQVGSTYLDLPKTPDPASWTGQQSRCIAVLRMLVLSAAYALAHRGGALIIDEAWVLLSHPSGAEQIDRAARLGRSWRTPIFLFLQNPSDIQRSGIERYTSRWIGLALDRSEVPIMANWMRVDAESRIEEWCAPEESDYGMRKIKDELTGEVTRGSLCWYRDSKGRVGLVEIDAPGDMARLFSTNAKANAERAALTAG